MAAQNTYKYRSVGLNQLTNIIRSFITDRTFQITIGNITSSPRIVLAGVPQGSCLTLQLFILYINGMPAHTKSNIMLFADEKLLHTTCTTYNGAANILQSHIKLIEPWFVEWKLNINANQTSSIMFSNRQTHDTKNIILKNTTLQWTNSIKYLGVYIDNNFTSTNT